MDEQPTPLPVGQPAGGADDRFRFPLLADSHPKGMVARTYGVFSEREDLGCRALFVIDEHGLIRWSQAYPTLVNPGVDGILCALEDMGGDNDW